MASRHQAMAQELMDTISHIALSGIVIDQKQGNAIEFASVGLNTSPLSTVTNLNGQFTFNIPKDLIIDSLVVSSIGYAVKSIPINAFKESGQLVIKLKQSETILEGVVVTDSLDGNEIMRLALERMESNHPNFPISMNAFYRERQMVDGKYVSLVEAAITIYDKNNFRQRKSPLRSKIRVDQLRRSLRYVHPYADWWNKENLLLHVWNLNPIPYALSSLYKGLKFENYKRVGKTEIHGQHTYLVKNEESKFWSTTYFIQAETYAFVRVEEYYDASSYGPKGWKLDNDSLDIDVRVNIRHSVIDFKKFQGKYYPSYIKFDSHHDYLKDEQKLFNFRIMQDVIINDLNIDSPIKIERNEAIRVPNSLSNKPYEYNKEFWRNFNIIQETPLEAKLIADLEAKISLEAQFQTQDQ